jgi:hypothetical protein
VGDPDRATARRHGLRRSRWVAVGASFGAAVALTGTIAAVNAAPSADASGGSIVRADDIDDIDEIEEADEYLPAQPFAPQSSPQPATPQVAPRAHTRSGGS